VNIDEKSTACWQEDIERLIKDFVKSVNSLCNSDTPVLWVNDRTLKRIWAAYKTEKNKFKRKNFGSFCKLSEHKIDRHKIIAIYIKVFLFFEPIKFSNGSISKSDLQKYDNLRNSINFANEFFCMKLMETILRGDGWGNYEYDDGTDKHRGEMRLDFLKSDEKKTDEKKWFLILLNHYRYNPQTLDILSLSHIIYYIEKSSFK